MLAIDKKIQINNIKKQLIESDSIIIRALEDLIVSISKDEQITKHTFPKVIYDEIKRRKELREKLKSLMG